MSDITKEERKKLDMEYKIIEDRKRRIREEDEKRIKEIREEDEKRHKELHEKRHGEHHTVTKDGINNKDGRYDEKIHKNNHDDFFNVYRVKSILLLAFVIFIYIVLFSLLNNAKINTPESKPWIVFIEIALWIVLIVILVLNVRHFKDKDFDFENTFKHLFDDDKRPEFKVHVHKEVEEKPKEECKKEETGEVFHIGGNNYTYEQAQDVCNTYDSRLATYDQVEKAYMNGANWCSYGWSEGQMALFPIQKAVFNELKKIPNHEHDCGRPGVNGGYMKKKDLKFGVNCYGKKPFATDKDIDFMNKHTLIHVSDEKIKAEKDKKISKFLVAPFNKEKWAELM